MQTYGEWSPTGFDQAGAFLPNHLDWLVAPVTRNRDSGALEESNFATALEMLGGESKGVGVYRFGHWACGWFEIILINPRSRYAVIAAEMEESLSDYPVLDEDDFCSREQAEYEQGWKDFAASEFRRRLIAFVRDDEDGESLEAEIDDKDDDQLREFYESLRTNGEFYIGESNGVSIPVGYAIDDMTRGDLVDWLFPPPPPRADQPLLFAVE